jgi:hypothetical protein
MAHFLPCGYNFYRALRVSRYKVDRSREIITGYKIGGGHWSASWRIAVQFISEPEISHGAGFKLRTDTRFAHRSGAKVGVWVYITLQSCLGSRSKAKTVTNNLPILSVLWLVLFLLLSSENEIRLNLVSFFI